MQYTVCAGHSMPMGPIVCIMVVNSVKAVPVLAHVTLIAIPSNSSKTPATETPPPRVLTIERFFMSVFMAVVNCYSLRQLCVRTKYCVSPQKRSRHEEGNMLYRGHENHPKDSLDSRG